MIADYIRTKPLPAALRLVWISLNFILSAALFWVVAFGPLNASIPLCITAAILGGLLGAGVWGLQLMWAVQGQKDRARRLGWALGLVMLIITLDGGGFALVQSYQFGQMAPLTADRVENFERLWWAMERAYPYFELKGVDWDEVHARYLPQIEAAQTDEEYFGLIGAMLAELNDAHTNLMQPVLDDSPVFASARWIEGQAVITVSGRLATAAGMLPGSVVLSVDGVPTDEYIAALPHTRGASSAWERAYWDASSFLRVPADGSLDVVYEDPSGAERAVTLDLRNLEALPPAEPVAEPPVVSSARLESGVGVITIRRFWNRDGEDLVAEFDAALDSMMDAPGIILDIRGNGGGDSTLADAVAGRFLSSVFHYGTEYHPMPLSNTLWRQHMDQLMALPRGKTYTGPLVLLTDEGCLSSTEWFILALVDSGRAVTVGRNTGGGTGNPIVFQLAGGEVRFSTGDFFRNNGQRIEGTGIAPDYPVEWSIAQFRAGQDPDLAKGEEVVRAVE